MGDATAAALLRPWTRDITTQQAWEVALGIASDGARDPAASAFPGGAAG